MPGQPQMWTDPQGRVHVVETDDRGQSFNLFQSQPASVLGLSVFNEIIRLEMERARRGHLYISAAISTTAAFTNQYLAIAYNVVGYRGSAGNVLFRGGLTLASNLADFRWDEPETYTSIGIEGKAMIDGVGSTSNTGITTMTLSVFGTYWR